MINQIKDTIENYSTILIFRHKEPDYDALGSQLGLKALLQDNYPQKSVFAVGQDSQLDALGMMDHVEIKELEKALAIVVDVAQMQRIDDERFKQCDKVIVIDHHQNDSDCANLFWQDKESIAAAEMIATLAKSLNWKLSHVSAKALMTGIVSDSGRFLYKGVSAKTFEAAAWLMKEDVDLDEMYQSMYLEDLTMKRMRGYALSQFIVLDSGIAYLRNSPEIKRRFNVTDFAVSRGLVSTMSQIKGVHAWVNFTETDDGHILTEIRSARVPLDDVAKSFGGGGHQLACGCTLTDWEETQKLIQAIEKKVESYDLK